MERKRKPSLPAQQRAKVMIHIIELLKIESLQAKAIALRIGIDVDALSSYLVALRRSDIIVNTNPGTRKGMYELTKRADVVEKALAEYTEIIDMDIKPYAGKRGEYVPKKDRRISAVANTQTFRHSELHMRLFYSVYKSFLSENFIL